MFRRVRAGAKPLHACFEFLKINYVDLVFWHCEDKSAQNERGLERVNESERATPAEASLRA